jgi:hypothetical protein
MTRYGHTPYLQAIFKSSASVYGSKSLTQANWDLIEVEGNNEVGSDDLGIYYETIYEQGFVRVKVVVESVGQVGIEEYLKHNESSGIFSAGLVALGTTSRVRRYFNGQVDFDSAEEILKFKSEVTLSVEDLMGTLQLEPVVIAKIDLIDPLKGLSVLPGTVLASSGSVVLKDKPLENKFGDLFRYEWINFSETENYKNDELFDIDFVSVPPRILLNKGIQNFHFVMDRDDNERGIQPKPVRSRRVLDTEISASVLQACGASVISRIRSKAAVMREDDPQVDEFGDIYDSLTANEQSFIQGFRTLLTMDVELENNYQFCDQISKASESAINEHLTSRMLRNIQRYVDGENGLMDLLDLAGFPRD